MHGDEIELFVGEPIRIGLFWCDSKVWGIIDPNIDIISSKWTFWYEFECIPEV